MKQSIVWAASDVRYVDGLQLDWDSQKKGAFQVHIDVSNNGYILILVIYIVQDCVLGD